MPNRNASGGPAASPGHVEPPAHAGPPGLSVQSLRSGSVTQIELLGPASDDELPPALRGKGLVRGKPLAIWPVGRSQARDGRVFIIDAAAIASLLEDGNGAGQPLPLTYVHEDPAADPDRASKTAGYAMKFRADEDYIYADAPYWTAAAAGDIARGERGYISPDAYCEALDPVTLERLADGSETNTFRPLKWRAASLVPVPALTNLPPASLSAGRSATSPASASQTKEPQMEFLKKVLALLGLPEDATEEQMGAALAALEAKLTASASPPAAAGEAKGCEPAAAEMQALVAAAGGIGALRTALAAVTEKRRADEAQRAEADAEARAAKHAKLESEKAAAKRAAEAIDAELLRFETEGRLVPAERDEFRRRLTDPALATGARQQLSSRAFGARVPDGDVTSGGVDPSISVDKLPRKEAAVVLSRTTAWAAQSGKQFHEALADVRGGRGEAEAFHRQVLKSNPDWTRMVLGEELTHQRGEPWTVAIRPVSGAYETIGVDPELQNHVMSLVKAGAFRELLPDEGASPNRLVANMLRRQKLSEAGNFQPGSRYTVPGFAVAVRQGDYAADLIAPPITGGANEECSYPIFSSESLVATVGEDGYPRPVGRETEATEETRWGVIWQKIRQDGYSNRVRADRRDQRAGDAVLPIGVLAYATAQALAIEKNKREIYVSKLLRTAANYAATSQFDLAAPSARSYENPSSTPLQDFKKVDNQLWRDAGQPTEARLIPRDVLTALQYHPDFVRFAQIATQGQGKPMAYAPEAFIAMALGPIITPTARISTRRGGTTPDTPWGQDVISFLANAGEVMAPRAFATVVVAGFPIVQTFPHPEDGLIGVDVVKVSDMYAPQVVGSGNDGKTVATPTSSAFLLQNASPALGQASL